MDQKIYRIDAIGRSSILANGDMVFFEANIGGETVQFGMKPNDAQKLGARLQEASVKADLASAPSQPLGAQISKEVLAMQSVTVRLSNDGELLLLDFLTTPLPSSAISVPADAVPHLQKEIRSARDQMEKMRAANRPDRRN